MIRVSLVFDARQGAALFLRSAAGGRMCCYLKCWYVQGYWGWMDQFFVAAAGCVVLFCFFTLQHLHVSTSFLLRQDSTAHVGSAVLPIPYCMCVVRVSEWVRWRLCGGSLTGLTCSWTFSLTALSLFLQCHSLYYLSPFHRSNPSWRSSKQLESLVTWWSETYICIDTASDTPYSDNCHMKCHVLWARCSLCQCLLLK